MWFVAVWMGGDWEAGESGVVAAAAVAVVAVGFVVVGFCSFGPFRCSQRRKEQPTSNSPIESARVNKRVRVCGGGRKSKQRATKKKHNKKSITRKERGPKNAKKNAMCVCVCVCVCVCAGVFVLPLFVWVRKIDDDLVNFHVTEFSCYAQKH